MAAHKDKGRRAVIHGRGIGCRYGAAFLKHRVQSRYLIEFHIEGLFVFGKYDRVSFALQDLHRNDFGGEFAVGPGSLRTPVTFTTESILVFPADATGRST